MWPSVFHPIVTFGNWARIVAARVPPADYTSLLQSQSPTVFSPPSLQQTRPGFLFIFVVPNRRWSSHATYFLPDSLDTPQDEPHCVLQHPFATTSQLSLFPPFPSRFFLVILLTFILPVDFHVLFFSATFFFSP